jgi:predicted alpha/beta-hydrolase family hydrolase
MGKPEQRRDTHFRYLTMPVLFASGTRDTLAPRAELTRSARKVKGPVTMHWIDTADHGFRPLKSSGRSAAVVLEDVAAEVVGWVLALPG